MHPDEAFEERTSCLSAGHVEHQSVANLGNQVAVFPVHHLPHSGDDLTVMESLLPASQAAT